MKSKKIKTSKKLKQIGLWATWWWAVSCFYVLILIWLGRRTYADLSVGNGSEGFFSDWHSAITYAYNSYDYLPVLLALIVAVWVIGGIIWLQELKRAKISYRAAFKDLFLTIRK